MRFIHAVHIVYLQGTSIPYPAPRLRAFPVTSANPKIDAAATAADVTKSVNVLTALIWVAIAWREVKSITVQKCFRRAGILDPNLDIQMLCEDEDPFQDIDIQAGMSSLISCSMGTLSHCSVDEYIDGDNFLPTCVDIDGEDWDESWLNCLADRLQFWLRWR